MESKDNLFEGFDFTGLQEFSEFIETNEMTTDVEQPEGTDTQEGQQKQQENIFNNWSPPFEMEVDDEAESEETNESKETEDTPSNETKTEKDSHLTPYAKLLIEEGVLQDFDIEKFDGSADSLVEAFKQQVGRHVEEYKQQLDPRVKWLQDNVEEGVPLEKLLEIDSRKIAYNSITPQEIEENADLQKNIVREYLKRTTIGWSDAKIEKEIARLDDLGELNTESKSFLDDLKQLTLVEEQKIAQDAKLAREQASQQQAKALEDFKNTLSQTKEFIPGLELSPVMRDKIYKTLTTPVAKDSNGTPLNSIAKARAENPMDFEMKLAYIFELTQGFKDWSKLYAPAKKNAIKEFEAAAGRLDYNKTSGAPVSPVEKATRDEIIKGMRVFGK